MGQNHQGLPAAPAVACSAEAAATGLLKMRIVRAPNNRPTERAPVFNIESAFQKKCLQMKLYAI
jgi:hypothetical protein